MARNKRSARNERPAQNERRFAIIIILPLPLLSLFINTRTSLTQLEKNTFFGRRYVTGEAPLPSSEMCAEFYRLASRVLLRAGYEKYEISSFALKGGRSSHNALYWAHDPAWYAAGCGASSRLEGRRVTRPRELDKYRNFVASLGEVEGEGERESKEEVAEDFVMTALRTADGLDLGFMEREHGVALRGSIEEGAKFFIDNGMAEMLEGARLRLTDPEGFLFSNSVISEVFVAMEGRERAD